MPRASGAGRSDANDPKPTFRLLSPTNDRLSHPLSANSLPCNQVLAPGRRMPLEPLNFIILVRARLSVATCRAATAL
jgi:hypothetical protein